MGCFVGSTVGGALVDSYGFGTITMSFAGVYCFVFMANMAELIHRSVSPKKEQTRHDYLRLREYRGEEQNYGTNKHIEN